MQSELCISVEAVMPPRKLWEHSLLKIMRKCTLNVITSLRNMGNKCRQKNIGMLWQNIADGMFTLGKIHFEFALIKLMIYRKRGRKTKGLGQWGQWILMYTTDFNCHEKLAWSTKLALVGELDKRLWGRERSQVLERGGGKCTLRKSWKLLRFRACSLA